VSDRNDGGPADALAGIDPVTFQIVKHRLVRVTDEAVTALKRVSGAPNTNEGHDLMVALYTPDGDLLTGGVGFLHHYVGASEATKHVIERFEGDIGPGDVFMLNDPYTAALHPPDVYVIRPVFYEGALAAFSASFVHVADIGAVDPGGFSPNSTSVFHEGFQTPGVKIIEGGETRQDVLDTLLNMSRDPGMVELDIRSQIAANNVAADRLVELADEYGLDTVTRVGEALIDRSESQFRERLRELPDGEWQARQYLDSTPEERAFRVQLTLRKEGDELTFDFAGTDEQSEYGFNCTEIATTGGVLAPVFPLLCHDVTWNDGVVSVIDVEAPSGTIVNAERPAPISIATVGTLQMCNSLATVAVSKMLGSSDAYADRATGVWHGAHSHVSMEVDRGDETTVETLTDSFAGAGGGRAFDDGVDLGGEVVNVVARWGNVERTESEVPLRYLTRRFVADSGGPGEHRGGVGHEFALTLVESDALADAGGDTGFEGVDVVTIGRGMAVPHSTGVFGGSPGPTTDYRVVPDVSEPDGSFDPDAAESADASGTAADSSGSAADASGSAADATERTGEDAAWGVHALDEGDVFYVRLSGSGGYGDPLRRDAEAVARDVAVGRIAPETARREYAVPVDDEGDITDSPTEARERAREERLDAASHGQTRDVGDLSPTDRRFGPAVAVGVADGTEYAACADCEAVLGRADEDWKGNAAVRDRPVSATGTATDGEKRFRLRQFCCPDCGSLFDTEVARRDDTRLVSRLY